MTMHERVRRQHGPARVSICDTIAEAEQEAAGMIRDHLQTNAKQVLGLATGRTMVNVYAKLRQWHSEGALSFSNARSFNLDEYCGVSPDEPASFAHYMRSHLFDHVDMAEENIHFPAEDAPEQFDLEIAAEGGIDLQLLGIGGNGHIGFNEPGARREDRTRIVTLAEATREANAADFPAGQTIPVKAVTMGVATILDGRRMVLLATGSGKAEAVWRALRGPVDPQCPASYLQLHDDVTVICDRDAAQFLGDET